MSFYNYRYRKGSDQLWVTAAAFPDAEDTGELKAGLPPIWSMYVGAQLINISRHVTENEQMVTRLGKPQLRMVLNDYISILTL